jgi:hypothetical protein
MIVIFTLFLLSLSGLIALFVWNMPSSPKHLLATLLSFITILMGLGQVINASGGAQLLSIVITGGALALCVALLLQQFNR